MLGSLATCKSVADIYLAEPQALANQMDEMSQEHGRLFKRGGDVVLLAQQTHDLVYTSLPRGSGHRVRVCRHPGKGRHVFQGAQTQPIRSCRKKGYHKGLIRRSSCTGRSVPPHNHVARCGSVLHSCFRGRRSHLRFWTGLSHLLGPCVFGNRRVIPAA